MRDVGVSPLAPRMSEGSVVLNLGCFEFVWDLGFRISRNWLAFASSPVRCTLHSSGGGLPYEEEAMKEYDFEERT
jgi:hypothetical protein